MSLLWSTFYLIGNRISQNICLYAFVDYFVKNQIHQKLYSELSKVQNLWEIPDEVRITTAYQTLTITRKTIIKQYLPWNKISVSSDSHHYEKSNIERSIDKNGI